ncbi:hypothetical protein HA152_07465 [Prochlorococcus marinus XMU1412]|uniref:hypothetical protein n=1 Tax=Prochlorococcus marinus TaxID=1219 RepID=UPI001ADBD3B3|nr:hypothetical protein [Prochlorococcus marinus]MBO8240540.1 hypothetical protein [Prochlorococcus marinus XMU1412]MBW3071775.1 hypothetical protein [Prochlorococcus marinus str. MU1412]
MTIFKNKLFISILFIKLIAIFCFIPIIQEKYFNTFFIYFFNNPSLDIWSNFLLEKGDPLSFPYGPIMFMVFLPLTYIGHNLGSIIGLETYLIGLGFKLTILVFDILGFILIYKLFPSRIKNIIYFYWLSPLIFYVTYIHGQIDLIPSVLLLWAYFLLSINRFRQSGYLLGFAIASKLSSFLILPIPIIYLWQNKRFSKGLPLFCNSLLFSLSILVFSPLSSTGYREMVFGTPLKTSLFWLRFPLGNDSNVFILPIVLILIFYSMWRIKRSNFTLLTSITGLVFLIAALMMPPTPGWFLWSLPFLIIYQINSDLTGKLSVLFFSLISIIFMVNNFSGSNIYFLGNRIVKSNLLENNFSQDFLYTLFIGIGIILCLRLYRESIKNNDYFKISRLPTTIGICGGPSSGKSILSEAIVDILGNHSVHMVYQKDYLKWSRKSPMWKTESRLKPISQDFLRLSESINILQNKQNAKLENNGIESFKKFNENKNFIIVNGYQLYQSKSFADYFGIKIFVEPSFQINKNWFNKNSKNENISNDFMDIKDIEKYRNLYSNQKSISDIIFSISNVNDEKPYSIKTNRNLLKLDVFLKNGIYSEKLVKALISICGLKVNLEIDEINLSSHLTIEGEVWSEDIMLVSKKLIPDLSEIIDVEPKWRSDSIGIMQLIVLMQASQFFKCRNLNLNEL